MSQEQITLESNIIKRLESDFDADQFPMAMQMLAGCGSTGHIARCIVVAAAGSLDAMQHYIQMAETDFQDVIIAGEYDESMQHIRDLRVSFLLDSPLDFWIGELAFFLHSRSFQLASLESQIATVGPFEYICDHGQGIAMFQKGNQTLTIQKQDRRWQVLGDPTEFHAFQLHVPYDDEDQFRNQLAWMLSEK